MTSAVKVPKKLIEVALPLDAINAAAAREKSIRHGHPSTLHLWWARRPLAAARAVIFGQMVNDPSWKWEMEHPGEIPPKFAGRPPVSLAQKQKGTKADLGLSQDWPGAAGLAEDVRHYGAWMRDEAQKRIGHLYPPVEVTAEMVKERTDLKHLINQKLTVIAWLWTRTVKCPNPACGKTMPLLSSFILSSKEGKEAYLVPRVGKNDELIFDVSLSAPRHLGELSDGFKRGMSGIFECIHCKTTTTRDYTAEQACKVGLGSLQTAVVCEAKGGRI